MTGLSAEDLREETMTGEPQRRSSVGTKRPGRFRPQKQVPPRFGIIPALGLRAATMARHCIA
jgi:hypothetical protein